MRQLILSGDAGDLMKGLLMGAGVRRSPVFVVWVLLLISESSCGQFPVTNCICIMHPPTGGWRGDLHVTLLKDGWSVTSYPPFSSCLHSRPLNYTLVTQVGGEKAGIRQRQL